MVLSRDTPSPLWNLLLEAFLANSIKIAYPQPLISSKSLTPLFASERPPPHDLHLVLNDSPSPTLKRHLPQAGVSVLLSHTPSG